MFRTVPLSVIRSFSLYTQQWYMSYRFADRKLKPNPYVLPCVQWKTADDGQRNCPKHVEFYSKNEFEKLLHLVGFRIRWAGHVARMSEESCVYRILVGKPEGRRPLGRPRHRRVDTGLREESGFPDPDRKLSETCMTYTIAVCTVKNPWWWTEELSEPCRFLFQ